MKARGLAIPLVLCLATSALAQISVTPNTLDFGNITRGQTKSLAVQVKNSGTIAMTATVSSTSPAFSVSPASLSVNPNQTVSLNVSLATSSPAGAQTASITIQPGSLGAVHINPAFTQPLRIGVKANVLAPVSLSVNPPSLSFGTVAIGQSKTLNFLLQNLNQAVSCTFTASFQTVPFNQFSTVPNNGTGRFFTASPPSISPAANAQTSVNVTFTPTADLQASANGQVTGLVTVSCGNITPRPTIALQAAAQVPQRFKISVGPLPGAGGTFATLIDAKVAGDQYGAPNGLALHCDNDTAGLCNTFLLAGAAVNATASCNSGAVDHWSGTGSAASCNGQTSASCSFTMSSDTTIAAQCK